MRERRPSTSLGGRLSGRRRRVAVVVASVALAASAGVGGATATTKPAGNDGPPRVLTSPGGTLSDVRSGQARPAAVAVPQAAHTGSGWTTHPLMASVQGWKSGTTPQLTRTTPTGYTPARLRASLHLTGTGKGQTVAVVNAFDNPYAAQDLTTYSKQFGLPVPCTKQVKSGCFTFTVAKPYGVAGADPGWALESSLDVQTVHALAPEANIVLVEARDNAFTSMFQALDYATGLGAGVISNSWGADGEFDGETGADRHCALASALCVFSAGDNGNPGGYPSYNPYVLSVGGTTLGLTQDGEVDFEVAWCCSTGATGGGVSAYEPRPAYQDGVNPDEHRGIPDVSFNADPYTGVPVYDTAGVNGQNGWFQLGGTSAGAPAWAGIVAAADQLRAKAKRPPLTGANFQAQKLIYSMPHTAFRDITRGAGNLIQCTGEVRTCRAKSGYDTVTGWGSPGSGIDVALAAAR
ncbi:S53 family peptidase [Actinoallomurus sp. CA-142502]|uniref:S53 family peptidase n=1 Tax=Actinoallomurus sp. CA-142502 TaxID=3239885 RepID=UPI003D8B81E4